VPIYPKEHMELTDDKAIELGGRAEALLNSQTFNMVINELGSQYVDMIMNSLPNEKMVREDNYHLHRALQDITRTLAGYVAARKEVTDRLEYAEEAEKE
jgi:hypothetical protein